MYFIQLYSEWPTYTTTQFRDKSLGSLAFLTHLSVNEWISMYLRECAADKKVTYKNTSLFLFSVKC